MFIIVHAALKNSSANINFEKDLTIKFIAKAIPFFICRIIHSVTVGKFLFAYFDVKWSKVSYIMTIWKEIWNLWKYQAYDNLK